MATPWEASDAGLAGYLQSLTGAPDKALWAATLLHFGYMGFLPMFLALAVMTRARWRITGTIGVAAGLLTAVGLPGLLVTDFYDLALGQTLPIDQAVAASAQAQEPWMAALAGGAMMVMMATVGVQTLRMTPQQWRTGRR